MKRFPIPAIVGCGAVVWGVLLVLVWAIHPVEVTAEYVTVEDPSASEQASIDEVSSEFEGELPRLFNSFQCDSNPLQAATGGDGASQAPSPPAGFDYVDSPCSSAYTSAAAAFWINAVVLAAIVAACIAIHLRLRKRPSEASSATDSGVAELLVDG